MMTIRTFLCFALTAPVWAGDPADEWPSYGRDPGGQRFSPLSAINRDNVGSLRVAWTYRTGDAYTPPRGRPTAFEATPLYVDGVLYLSTPVGRVIALDPVTGKERWSYDAKAPKDSGYGDFASRGVSTWVSPAGERRIFVATIDARLISLDAVSGKPSSPFGDNGVVDLRQGLRIAPRGFADYEQTSPPAVIGNTIVVGSAIADNGAIDLPSGEVRGFDAVTGKLKWTWDPIPQSPDDPAAKTWATGDVKRTGGANAWSVIAADPERGLAFVPTGSPAPDYYGGERKGDNLYANSVVALRAETGDVAWHFQMVHHDLWDYDVASPPMLFDVYRNGRTIPAVGVAPKNGYYYVLNRETGEPVFGVREMSTPKSDVPGEAASPTQPVPVAPPALASQKADPWGVTDADRQWCADRIATLRAEGAFTPPSLRGSYVVPGNIGGVAWGGAAYDAANHMLIIPSNNLAAEVRLIPRADLDRVRAEMTREPNNDWEFAAQRGTPYAMARRFLRAPSGLPCTQPPWGVVHGVDADTGELKWTSPVGRFGEAPPEFGSLILGGPIATAGGVAFQAGTVDAAIYAFDTSTGKQLWRGELPTSARATPMTYRGPDGKQYVVIAAGGHGIGFTPLGDYLVAFTLP